MKNVKIRNILFKPANDFKIKNLNGNKILKLCIEENWFIEQLKGKDVNGRLELVKTYKNGVKVFVDYAHTPDALLKSITSLIKDYKIIFLVFDAEVKEIKKETNYSKNAVVTVKKTCYRW